MKFGLVEASRRSAWRHTPRRLESWRDDIAQDVAEYVVQLDAMRGIRGEGCFDFAARHAVRRLVRQLRHDTLAWVDGWDEADFGALPRPEFGAIALARLQRHWEEMTELQRLAVGVIITGESPTEAARPLGLRASDILRAARTAFERMDGLRRVTRGGRRAALSGLCPKAPEVLAASRAKAAARERARRRGAI